MLQEEDIEEADPEDEEDIFWLKVVHIKGFIYM